MFAAAITTAFVVIAGFQTFHHVMWLDEWQAWLLAKDSQSVAGVLRNLRYETHPPLWHLCLYFISRVTGDFRAMQAFHVAIAAAGVFVVALRSPLSRLQVVLYAFGFLVIYEYCVVSRCYGLGFLLMLLAVAMFRRGPGRLGYYLLLALMAQVDAFAMVVALALAAADLTRMTRATVSGLSSARARPAIVAVGLLVLAISCLACCLKVIPVADSSYPNTHGAHDPLATLGSLYCAWAPIPHFGPHFWSTNIVDGYWFSTLVESAYSLVLFAIALTMLSTSREAITLLVVGCAGIMIEVYLSRQQAFRHTGHFFMVLIAAYWIAEEAGKSSDRHARSRRRFLTFLLILQIIPTLWAFHMERTLPFSDSKKAAEFIKANLPADIPVVMANDMSGPALSGYLGRPVYYESRQAFGTYLMWDSRRRDEFDPFAELIDFQSKYKCDVIFSMAPHRLQGDSLHAPPQLHLTILKEFDQTIDFRDQYELSLAKYVPENGR